MHRKSFRRIQSLSHVQAGDLARANEGGKLSCKDCPIHRQCGGLTLDNQNYLTCFLECGSCRNNEYQQCLYACPNNPEYFMRELASVGSLDYRPTSRLKAPSSARFPLYIPQIHHGYRRVRPFRGTDGYVAISVADIFSKRWQTNCTARDLRRHFTVDPSAKILALGIADDVTLEKWWGYFTHHLNLLKRMGVSAVTTPNFSIFENAPRSQTMIHIGRIHKFNELLSSAGLAVIPHVYAQTAVDWAGWKEFLREQNHLSTLAMEFQTGLQSPFQAKEYIRNLEELQQSAGRPLSLVAVGAARYIENLVEVFGERLTIVDSNPFMKAMWRRGTNVIGPLNAKWIERHTQKHEPVDSLFSENVTAYESRLELRAGRASSSETSQIAA